MKPEIKITEFPYRNAALFQCIGGDNPVHSVYENMAKWIKREGLDYKNRMIASVDYPHPAWCPPPYGCMAFYFVNDNEIVDNKFKSVHVMKLDTDGEYATLDINCYISEAWDILNAFRDKGEYAFDTENGRQYFEQHIFSDDNFTHDERLNFNIWMPIKKI